VWTRSGSRLGHFLYNSLAPCLEVFDWNWEAADREFRRAIELNPGYATAHHWYAWHLILVGRNSEAVSEISNVLLETSPSMDVVFDVDRVNVILQSEPAV
jgi:hypothetical protein